MMQRVLVALLALLSCALAAPVAPATAAAPLKPVAKAKGGGRSDMMKGLAATLSPDNKKAFKALVAEKKLAKGEAAIRAPGEDQDAPGRLVRQLRGRQGGEEGRREGRRRRAEAAAAAQSVGERAR